MDLKLLVRKFCDYSSFIKGFSRETIRRYEGTVVMFCKYAKISTLEEVNDDVARNFFYFGRTSRKWSPNTFITYHKSLAVFFRWCVKGDLLEVSRLTRHKSLEMLQVYNDNIKFKADLPRFYETFGDIKIINNK